MGFEEEVTGSLLRLKNDASDVASHAVGNTALRERISATGVNAIPIDGAWAPTIPIPYQYPTNTLPITYQIGRVIAGKYHRSPNAVGSDIDVGATICP